MYGFLHSKSTDLAWFHALKSLDLYWFSALMSLDPDWFPAFKSLEPDWFPKLKVSLGPIWCASIKILTTRICVNMPE